MSVKAYLFDMDGTLANSEKFFIEAACDMVKEYNADFTYSEILDIIIGSTTADLLAFIVEVCSCTLEEAEEIHRKRFNDSLTDYAKYIYPETIEVLKTIKAEGYLIALVTSNNKANIDNFLSCIDENIFDCIVSSDILNIAAKPSPAPYLKAMEMLGVKPLECIVIEDSTMGIEAGLASEAYVIANTQSGIVVDTSRANRTIANLLELIR